MKSWKKWKTEPEKQEEEKLQKQKDNKVSSFLQYQVVDNCWKYKEDIVLRYQQDTYKKHKGDKVLNMRKILKVLKHKEDKILILTEGGIVKYKTA